MKRDFEINASVGSSFKSASSTPAPSLPTDKVVLRLLVVSATETDPGLAAWTDVLQRLGTPFYTFVAANEPLTRDRLVAPDGGGRYYGVLLADGALAYRAGDGWQSAFSADEWALLWAYERDYAVRQVALYSYPGPSPEDYGLRLVDTKDVGEDALLATPTPAGQRLFSYLRPDALVPIRHARACLAACDGARAEPLLSDEAGHVLAALSPSEDGRERVALTVAQGPRLLHTQLLGYGLVRWVTRGLFWGERRVFYRSTWTTGFRTVTAGARARKRRVPNASGCRLETLSRLRRSSKSCALHTRWRAASRSASRLSGQGPR